MAIPDSWRGASPARKTAIIAPVAFVVAFVSYAAGAALFVIVGATSWFITKRRGY